MSRKDGKREGKQITPKAYAQLIHENLLYLAIHCPDSLERTHIKNVLISSVDLNYPGHKYSDYYKEPAK